METEMEMGTATDIKSVSNVKHTKFLLQRYRFGMYKFNQNVKIVSSSIKLLYVLTTVSLKLETMLI